MYIIISLPLAGKHRVCRTLQWPAVINYLALIPRCCCPPRSLKTSRARRLSRYTKKKKKSPYTYLFRDTDLAVFHWGNGERGFFFLSLYLSLFVSSLTFSLSVSFVRFFVSFRGMLLWHLQWSWLMTTSHTQCYSIRRTKNNKRPTKKKKKPRFGRPSESSIKSSALRFRFRKQGRRRYWAICQRGICRNSFWHSMNMDINIFTNTVFQLKFQNF